MSSEEQEEIPWSMLLDHEQRGRSRTLYIGAAVILAVVIGFTGIRWVNDHRHGDTPPETPAASPPTTLPPAPTTTELLSEADLMAVDPATVSLAAVARAEWFVTDYFTVDGAPPPDLLDAFGDDATLPELPHSAVDGTLSFVEWARASAIRPHQDGLIVTVLFRTLYENDEPRFERSAVRAVEVLVLIDGGMTAVGDLPIPVEVPAANRLTGWNQGGGEAPPDAVTEAIEYAGRFGGSPTVLSSGSFGGHWRVVLTVDDPSGLRIPIVVRSDIKP